MEGKREVAIVADSTSYIPDALVNKHDLSVFPQILNWEGTSYLDGADISNETFYQRLPAAKELPTSAKPSIGQFIEAFEKLKYKTDSIVYIVISDHLSGTLDSARVAALSVSDIPIEVTDSRSMSMGLGMLVLLAASMAEEGRDHLQIASSIRSLIPHQRLLFWVDTLEYLHKGGRIGGTQRLLGSVLSVKPILHIDDGRIEPMESLRTKNKALNRLLELVQEQTAGWTDIYVEVVDASAPDTAAYIYDQLWQKIKAVEMYWAGLSPVVGVHAGPGAIGVTLLNGSPQNE